MKHFLLFIGLLMQLLSQAQTCDQFPADCPVNVQEEQDTNCCLNNFIIPQEIKMQNKLRSEMTSLMEAIAEKNKWQVYQYTEMEGSAIGIDGNTKPLPYSLTPPHLYSISFIFIVDKDSLLAWQHWHNTELLEKANAVVDAYKQADNSSAQIYFDSANYYGDKKARYMTDHSADYQKAILGNDQKAVKKYENEMKWYDDKINGFINKTNNKNDENFSNSNSKNEDFQTYRHNTTVAFRNKTMIRIKIDFNYNMEIATEADAKLLRQLAVPGASFAILVHNDQPDENEVFDLNQFTRSPDVAMALFGKWSLKPDEYHNYHAAYSLDEKNTDAVTPKRITCDKVQTISVHVEGSTKNISQFLQTLNTEKLNSMIVSK